MNANEIMRIKVAELRTQMRSLSLPITGRKDELRMLTHYRLQPIDDEGAPVQNGAYVQNYAPVQNGAYVQNYAHFQNGAHVQDVALEGAAEQVDRVVSVMDDVPEFQSVATMPNSPQAKSHFTLHDIKES